MSYASVVQVRDRIGRLDHSSFGFPDSSSFERYIANLVERASRLVDRYCCVPDGFFNGGVNVNIVASGREVREGVKGGVYYQSPYIPVLEVSSVEVNVGDDANPVWKPVTYINDMGRIYLLEKPQLKLKQCMRISMKVGFEDIEPVVQTVVVESVAAFLLEYIRFLRDERKDTPVLELKGKEYLDRYRLIPLATG